MAHLARRSIDARGIVGNRITKLGEGEVHASWISMPDGSTPSVRIGIATDTTPDTANARRPHHYMLELTEHEATAMLSRLALALNYTLTPHASVLAKRAKP